MTQLPRRPNAIFNDAIPAEVLASLHDPARLCPTLAGPAWLQGDRLKVRTRGGELEVRASRALLAQLHALCDGTSTVEEIVAQAPARQAPQLREFLAFLLREGVLVDADLLTLRAASHAHQGSAVGRGAPARVTRQLCRRFLWNEEGASSVLPTGTREVPRAPMSELFAARVSTCSFGDRALDDAALFPFLWSIAGVVSTWHERLGDIAPKRTLASAGGMHLLEPYVVLQRPVGSCVPGVYRVRYPVEKCVALEALAGDPLLLPRAFIHPEDLAHATGAIFLAADGHIAAMRYRNRATQYLFMEAGAALHNAALSAPPLGMGFVTIGGYDETVVASLCGLGDKLILGSGIFGAATR